MVRKIIFRSILFIMLLVLSRCQFNKQDTPSTDRLVGALITFDINNFRNQERIYATLQPRTLTNEDGKSIDNQKFVFEGLNGISYFAATLHSDENNGSYVASYSDDGITDVHVGIHAGDNEDKINLEGTIFVSASVIKNKMFFINPIYQSDDGSVYAVSGNGVSMGGYINKEWGTIAHTLNDTVTITENGKLKSKSCSIKISFTTMFPPERISIIQMDEESNRIAKNDYSPENYLLKLHLL